MNLKYILGGTFLAGIAGIKFLPKILLALGIGAAVLWTADDVQDYVDNTIKAGYLNTDFGGLIVTNIRAEDRIFVSEYDITDNELANEFSLYLFTKELSCDSDVNEEILSNIEAYKDIFFLDGKEFYTNTTTIEDCK